MKSILFY